ARADHGLARLAVDLEDELVDALRRAGARDRRDERRRPHAHREQTDEYAARTPSQWVGGPISGPFHCRTNNRHPLFLPHKSAYLLTIEYENRTNPMPRDRTELAQATYRAFAAADREAKIGRA